MSRTLLLSVVLACLCAVQPSWASQPDFRLQVVPAVIYKVGDPGKYQDLIVRVRHRRGDPDINSFAALHVPVMAFYGDCVIIDHGNSEYSVLAHMQQGSVRVKAGERVAAGQVIGKLGNSGDSFGPHLHYQLQAGPQLFHDQGLPFRFQNIDVPQLSRGTNFDAK